MIEYIFEGLDIKLKDFFDDEIFNNIEMKDQKKGRNIKE